MSGQGLIVKFARMNYRKFALSIRGPKIWNDIPISIRQVDNICQFKRNWRRYMSESYHYFKYTHTLTMRSERTLI